MTNTITVAIPEPLVSRAKGLKMNISEVCRIALADAITNAEEYIAEQEANLRQNVPVTATTETPAKRKQR